MCGPAILRILVQLGNEEPTTSFVISAASLPALADCGRVISYAFYSITLKVHKKYKNQARVVEKAANGSTSPSASKKAGPSDPGIALSDSGMKPLR